MLRGYARLELARERKVGGKTKREVVKVIEHKNDITPWTEDVLNEGNFHYQIQPSKLMPVSQFFDGCLLTDKDNVANLSMIASDSNVTAQAGNNSYSGLNDKRGTYNQIESGVITGGIRQVWDWGTAYGNGIIKSVCLTRSALGCVEMHDDNTAFESTSAYVDELMNSSYEAPNMTGINIFDNGGRYAYKVYYEDNKIKIQKYDLNNELLIIRGGVFSPVEVGTPVEINEALTSPTTATVSYTGNYLHVIETSGGTFTIIKIDMSDWSHTKTSYAFENISIIAARSSGNYGIYMAKDVHLIVGDYIYTLATVGGNIKLVKCNMTNLSDVVDYDLPTALSSSAFVTDGNGPSVMLPNGDIYKFAGRRSQASPPALYFHNGVPYVVYESLKNITSPDNHNCIAANVIKGGIVFQKAGWTNTMGFTGIAAIYPYVSTVANLEEAVTKTASLTMKLTYDIVETGI